jgi:heptose I phosphotransferase
MEKLYFNDTFQKAWGKDPFVSAFAVTGEVFRDVKNRRTMRFRMDGKSYFIKLHGPVGWGEILKNLVQFKLPVIGSANEYLAISLLNTLGVPTMTACAFGIRGVNPAAMESFLVTEDLVGMVSLEDFCRDWKTNPPPPALKNRIIRALAVTIARMHASGLNHRDCYICHFLLDPASLQEKRVKLHVIDLHRAQLRPHIRRRYRVKDLAGIFFSAMDLGLSRRDALRFIAAYTPRAGALDAKIWPDVLRTAVRLYRKEFGREPGLPAECSRK